MTFSKNETVKWKWGNGYGEGKVVDIFYNDIEKTIKGEKIKRKASKDKPAYLIKQNDGDEVLKTHSEISSND